ncbi:hypothetical protein [Streptomyces atratus]|uniref:hypothetical protein n=1 Tax=Streptomyces atratus TaxID=1893 RepID=UPI00379DA0AB
MEVSDDRYWRRRRIRLTAGWTAAAVVAAGGFIWLSGGYSSWRHDRALDSVCDGDLAAGQVRKLFPGIELKSSGDHTSGGWRCSVSAADGHKDGPAGLTLRVRDADARFATVDASGFDAPLGHGWTGSFAFSPDDAYGQDEARASLLLDCGKEPGSGLVMTVDAKLGEGGFDNPAARERLTAVLTGTATAYAHRVECAAPLGKPVKDVGVTTTDWDYKPLTAANGTCAGLLSPATAQRWGVRTAVETAAAPAPLESCELGGLQGARRYGFTAYYGLFGQEKRDDLRYESHDKGPDGKDPVDAEDGTYTLVAECPGADGAAVYEVGTLRDDVRRDTAAPAVDHKGLRAALQRFADASARRHGCTAPRPA